MNCTQLPIVPKWSQIIARLSKLLQLYGMNVKILLLMKMRGRMEKNLRTRERERERQRGHRNYSGGVAVYTPFISTSWSVSAVEAQVDVSWMTNPSLPESHGTGVELKSSPVQSMSSAEKVELDEDVVEDEEL